MSRFGHGVNCGLLKRRHSTAFTFLRPMLAWLGLGLPLCGQIRVEKPAAAENPTLCIASFAGPQQVEAALRRVLVRADWFNVVPASGGAEYTLDCRHSPGPPAALDLTVRSSTGAVVNLRQSVAGNDETVLVCAAVDALIQAVFRSPGPCLSRIAFVVGQRGCKEVFVSNFDGTGARQITFNGTISTEPAWGHDGSSLVYTLYQNNTTSVVLLDVSRQAQRRLSWFPGLNAGARLSPDGQWVALCLSRDARVELYLMSVATRQLRRLTNDRAVESSPCWSPDGSRLCFVSDRLGQPRLFVMPAAGGTATPLVGDAAEAVSPDWSPVTNKICYAKRMGPNYQLAVVDMLGGTREVDVVTRMDGDWESPSWSPDGRHVVCSRDHAGRRGLWIVDTWFGRAFPITEPADHSLPSWSVRR